MSQGFGRPALVVINKPISDQAAIEFSRGFYDAIGVGSNYNKAYEEGVDKVKPKNIEPGFSATFYEATRRVSGVSYGP